MSTEETLKLILGELKEHKKDFQDFKKSQKQQAIEFRELYKQLKDENSSLKNIVTGLQEENHFLNLEVSRLSIGFNSITQENLSKNLIIAGIPFVEREDLPGLIIKAASILKVDLTPADFKAKRIFAKVNKGFSNILVKFFDIEIKYKLIKNRKQFALLPTQLGFDNKKEILLFHQLTAYNLELLAGARKIKTKFNFKFAWFQNNQILLRKAEKTRIFAIRSKQQLIELDCLLEDNKSKETSIEIIDLEEASSSKTG